MKTFFTRIPQGKAQDRVDKFGLASDPADGEYLWEIGHELLDDPDTTPLYISGSDTDDTDINVTIEYVDPNGVERAVTGTTDDTDAFVFVEVLDGSTPALSCAFVNRAYVADDSVVLEGDIYLSKDNTDVGGNGIPDTITDVKAHIPQAHNQTMQVLYMVPANKVLHVEGWNTSLARATGVAGSVEATLKFKTSTGSWRTVHGGGMTSSGNTIVDKKFPVTHDFDAGTIVAIKIEDVSTTGLITYGEIDCYLEPA